MMFDYNKPGKYVAVNYKGAQYMCVEDSPRAQWLNEAHIAWRMGYKDFERELFNKAINSPGCAFKHREVHNG